MLFLIFFKDIDGSENIAVAQGINLDMAEEHVEAVEHGCQIHDYMELVKGPGCKIQDNFPDKAFSNEEKQFFTKNKYLVIKCE